MAFSFGNTTPAPGTPAPAPGVGGFSLGGSATTPTPATPSTGFNFGGTPAPGAPTPAPAGGGGGFGFGSTPAPAPGGAPAPAPTGGFNFGGSGSSSTPAPGPAGGISFGNPTPAPAPSTGFNFSSGSTTTTPGAPAPAPSTGFGFGTSTTATSAPSPSGGLFGNNNNPPAPAPGSTTTGATTQPPTLQAPSFDAIFPNLQRWSDIEKLLSRTDDMAGQELLHVISTCQQDLKPKLYEMVAPDAGLRQRLAQNPLIALHGRDSTTLAPKLLERILQLATDLRIPEDQAVSLFAQVSNDSETIEAIVSSSSSSSLSVVEQGVPTKKYPASSRLSREFYFYERHLRLQTLLFLSKSRLQNDPSIIAATDILIQNGLVSDLVQVIKDYSQRIMQLQQELARDKPPQHIVVSVPKVGDNFGRVHLLFCQKEREIAAECLFFLAYHTQLTASEMAKLIDLIQDLTRGMPKPNPFTDVPSPYEFQTQPSMAPTSTAWPPSAATTAQPYPFVFREKNQLEWEHEFVQQVHESGQTQLLQCVSLLVAAAMAAMETKQILYDRQLHGPNSFGRGNQLLPPDNPSHAGVSELQSRLNPDAGEQWTRPEIHGLLAMSYALLLQSAPSLLSSPRGGGADSFRHAARFCLELPAECKSFTFCRLSMVPALQRLPSPLSSLGNVSEFALAVLSESYSHYLDQLSEGLLPISRKRWEKEEEEELKLRRAQQVQQRQYMAWSGRTSSTEEKAIPSTVDLMSRPDCLEDFVALAAVLCSLGPEYARSFWGTTQDGKLTPSRVLQELGRVQSKDDSLIPSYLSWLAALANDETSANVVHDFLSQTDPGNTSTLNWATLIFNLRWYAQELSPYDAEVVSKPASSSNKTTTAASSSYYYNLDGDYIPMSSTTNTTSSATTGESSATTSSSNVVKELSELARFQVASHLAVISNVATHSAMARHAILSIILPVGDGGPAVAGGDEALLILFKLAIAPLSPAIRGATLSTIASLLQQPSDKEDKKSQELVSEQCKHAWEYLESCPLLPIALLDQYLAWNHAAAAADSRARSGLAFPPSSSTLANSSNAAKALLPKDQNYGIIYELEHVESQMGWYPSTEGFLNLLLSLIRVGGCPSNLGQNWRIRTGCAPYIEYVVDFVLPRAMGIGVNPQLPFRSKGDQSRLVCRALSVVESVVTRYSVPCAALKISSGASALSLLGIPAVVEATTARDPNMELTDDFKNLPVTSAGIQPTDANSTATTTSNNMAPNAAAASSIPSTKSPGFVVLANILSSSGGTIFQAIAMTLAHSGMLGGGGDKSQDDNLALAYALFGTTPPNAKAAKEGAKEGGPTKLLQTMLKGLFPEMQNVMMDSTAFHDASSWKEDSIIVALRILCATAAKEEAFYAAVVSYKEPLKIVPFMRFQVIRPASSNFNVVDVSLSKLTNLFFSANNAQYVRSAIVEFIGHDASSDARDAELSACALSLSFFMQQSMAPHFTLRELCGNNDEKILSKAVARRLLLSCRRSDSSIDSQITNLILNWILVELRSGSLSHDGISQTLLGLPSATREGNWKRGGRKYVGTYDDCFDALLELLNESTLLEGSEPAVVPSLCYEIIFRLYDLMQRGEKVALRIVLHTAERLRSVNFWEENALKLLSSRSQIALMLREASHDFQKSDAHMLSCIAWLLQGLACEIRLLVGFAHRATIGSDIGLATMFAPRLVKCGSMLTLLFDSEDALVFNLVQNLPLTRAYVDGSLLHPPADALRNATYELIGPADVVAGYRLVNIAKVAAGISSSATKEDAKSMKRWCQNWNTVAAWDCACSHLASATHILVDTAVSCSEDLSLGGVTPVSGLQGNGLTDLLALILRRLHDDVDKNSRHNGMDAKLFPCATRNLSNAVLVLADRIAECKQHQIPSASDLLTVASLIARALTFSSIGDDSAVEAPTRYERTVVLASALSRLLRVTAAAEPEFVRQYRDDFLLATQALQSLARFKVDSASSEATAIVAVLARATFSAIVSACSDVDDTREESFVTNCLSKSYLVSILDLVGELDDNVCSLFEGIALQPFGAELLVDSGICHALGRAAEMYMLEEAKVEARLQSSNLSYNQAKVGNPVFLLSHLKLLSTLMASDSFSQKQASELSIGVLEIIGLYKNVLKRLCFNFPSEGDILRWFMRCLLQAAVLAQPINVNERHDLLATNSSKLKQLFMEAGFLENGIIMLVQHIMENPLPSDILPETPNSLQDSASTVDSSIVSVNKAKQQSWWDVLTQVLATRSHARFVFDPPLGRNDFGYWGSQSPQKWNEDTFEYSIVALDILALGLGILKRIGRFEKVNGPSFARGLFNCTIASQVIDNRYQEVKARVGHVADFMDTSDSSSTNVELEAEYLELLGASMSRSVEEILVTSCMLLETSKENINGGTESSLSKQLGIAIAQSGTDSKGVGCLSRSKDGEKRQELVSFLCAEIKKAGSKQV